MLLRSCRGPGIQAAVFSLIGQQRVSLRPPTVHLLTSFVRRASGASSLVIYLCICAYVCCLRLLSCLPLCTHLMGMPVRESAYSSYLCLYSCSMKDPDDSITASSWHDLGYHPTLASALAQNFPSPTTIQELAAAPLLNQKQVSPATGIHRLCSRSSNDENNINCSWPVSRW